MTEILEGLYPHNSCPLDCPYEETQPQLLCSLEQPQGKRQDWWQEDKHQVQESHRVSKGGPDLLPKGFGVFYQFGVDDWC
jgi:hypothetical protein